MKLKILNNIHFYSDTSFEIPYIDLHNNVIESLENSLRMKKVIILGKDQKWQNRFHEIDKKRIILENDEVAIAPRAKKKVLTFLEKCKSYEDFKKNISLDILD